VNPYYEDESVTLYHGDCREVLVGLADASFGAIVTDPPYGVGVAEWDKVADWEWATHADRLLTDPAHLFCFWSVMGLRQFPDIAGLEYERVVVWSKPMSRSSQRGNATWHWEPIFWFKKGKASLTECVSDVLTVNPPLFRTHPENVNHPTQKPLDVVRQLVQWSGAERILDPFAGSGTTLRAAADLGKRAVGIERDERYCEIAAKRLAQGVLNFDEAS
jgi:DNA modification methylase